MRFYLIAMIFIVFDIEIIFLYPWAVIYRNLGAFGLAEILLFTVAVLVSFVYLLSNGALDWGPAKQARRLSLDGVRRPHRGHHDQAGRARRPRRAALRGRGGVAMQWDVSQGPRGPRPQLPHRQARGPREVGAPHVGDAGHLRPGLLRHRDDGHRRRPLRHRPLRHGDVPRLAPPGRPHDRGRPGEPEDGAGAAADLRPDDGAQVGHQHGRVREQRRHVQQLRDRAGRRPDRARRRVRPGLPARARDADARHPHAAREDPRRRSSPAVRGEGARPRRSSSSTARPRRRPSPSGGPEPWPTTPPSTTRPRTAPDEPELVHGVPVTSSARPARAAPDPRAARRPRAHAARRRRLRHVPRRHRRRLPRLRRAAAAARRHRAPSGSRSSSS